MHGTIRLALAVSALSLGTAAAAGALTIDRDADADRWNYPFNATPGIRGTAPTFGSVGDPLFDDRDGQFLVGYDTAAAGAPTGQGAANYQIVSAKVTVTHSSGSFAYDDSYDSYETYDGTFPDSDPGRPIELHGLGFRPPFTSLELSPGIAGPPGFMETDAFAFADPTLPGVRNAFAMNTAGADVSNNVSGGFESDPWAIGQVSGLAPGSPVVEAVPGASPGSTFVFELNLTDPLIVAYLQNGLDSGLLGFMVSSLHATAQGGGNTPNFYSGDNFDPAAIAPTLEIEFDIVPEPGTALLCLTGLVGLGLAGRRKHRS